MLCPHMTIRDYRLENPSGAGWSLAFVPAARRFGIMGTATGELFVIRDNMIGKGGHDHHGKTDGETDVFMLFF